MPFLKSFAKVVWYLLCVACFSYYTWDITALYLKYETITNFVLRESIEAPAVSICYQLEKFPHSKDTSKICPKKTFRDCLESQPIQQVLETVPGIDAIIDSTSIDNRVTNLSSTKYYKWSDVCFRLDIALNLSLSQGIKFKVNSSSTSV